MSEQPGARADQHDAAGAGLLKTRRRGERLLALLMGGMVVLNFPLLSIFRDTGLVLGIPVLYLYLFAMWALLIVATALVLCSRSQEQQKPEDREAER